MPIHKPRQMALRDQFRRRAPYNFAAEFELLHDGSTDGHGFFGLYPCSSVVDLLRLRLCRVGSVSVEIVADYDDFCRALFFFLSPRRRSGERTEERGGPSSPQPSPPSDGGEGVYSCGFASSRRIARFSTSITPDSATLPRKNFGTCKIPLARPTGTLSP